MSQKYGLGLVSISMGAIAGDGGMGTSLSALGNTVQGSATLTSGDDTTTDFNIEEQDDPVQSIVSQKGKKTLAWSCYDVDGATLYKLFGGTYTPYNATGPVQEKWDAPAASVTLYQSIAIVDKNGNTINIVRALITAKFNWSFTKDKLAQIDLTAAVLTPTKANTPPITILYPLP